FGSHQAAISFSDELLAGKINWFKRQVALLDEELQMALAGHGAQVFPHSFGGDPLVSRSAEQGDQSARRLKSIRNPRIHPYVERQRQTFGSANANDNHVGSHGHGNRAGQDARFTQVAELPPGRANGFFSREIDKT